MSGNGSSVSVGIQSLQQASEDVQKIRSILRFLLGNLNDLTYAQLENIEINHLCLTDRYILHLLTEFISTVTCLSLSVIMYVRVLVFGLKKFCLLNTSRHCWRIKK